MNHIAIRVVLFGVSTSQVKLPLNRSHLCKLTEFSSNLRQKLSLLLKAYCCCISNLCIFILHLNIVLCRFLCLYIGNYARLTRLILFI